MKYLVGDGIELEWKAKVHSKVKCNALSLLNEEKNQLSKSSAYPDAEDFKIAGYISQLTVSNACLLFRVRSRIIDIKEFHQYKYENDKLCRCCELCEETLSHVWRDCPNLESEQCEENDEFSEDVEVLEKVVRRVEEFSMKIDIEEDEEVED